MTSLPDELSISEVRDNFAEVVMQANYSGKITYITRRGKRVGAVVPVEVAQAAEAAEDAYLSRLAADAEAELAAGAATRPLSAVLADLDLGPIQDETAGQAPLPRAPQPRAGADDSATHAEPRQRP